MAKRIAEKELTDRNWDQEDEAEEVSSFPKNDFLPLLNFNSFWDSSGRFCSKIKRSFKEQPEQKVVWSILTC